MFLHIELLDDKHKGRIDMLGVHSTIHVVPREYINACVNKPYMHRAGYYFWEDKYGDLTPAYAEDIYHKLEEKQPRCSYILELKSVNEFQDYMFKHIYNETSTELFNNLTILHGLRYMESLTMAYNQEFMDFKNSMEEEMKM